MNIIDVIITNGYILSTIYINIGSITCLFIFSLLSVVLISSTKYSITDLDTFSIIKLYNKIIIILKLKGNNIFSSWLNILQYSTPPHYTE